jgi:hypothetical protein
MKRINRGVGRSSPYRAVALCAAALAFAAGAQAAGDKGAYAQAKSSAKAAYESQHKQCDALSGNAKDVCVLQAKAARTRAEETAEAAYKDTDRARQRAAKEIAEADYKVAKEKCDDLSGNPKDVCVQEAKAALAKAKADAKAVKETRSARKDAAEEKRDADYKVAKEKCDALSGDGKSACLDKAKAAFGLCGVGPPLRRASKPRLGRGFFPAVTRSAGAAPTVCRLRRLRPGAAARSRAGPGPRRSRRR